MLNRDELILVLKYQQWEKCKGELKALVSLDGAARYPSPDDDRRVKLFNAIEQAIELIEDLIE